MLQSWQPNTLPMPFEMLTDAGETASDPVSSQVSLPSKVNEQVVIDVNDNFPKGRVSKFFQYQGYGFVTANNGKEYYFSLAELDFTGAKGKEAISIGAPVGYDVSYTSQGLHVKKMKLY